MKGPQCPTVGREVRRIAMAHELDPTADEVGHPVGLVRDLTAEFGAAPSRSHQADRAVAPWGGDGG